MLKQGNLSPSRVNHCFIAMVHTSHNLGSSGNGRPRVWQETTSSLSGSWRVAPVGKPSAPPATQLRQPGSRERLPIRGLQLLPALVNRHSPSADELELCGWR